MTSLNKYNKIDGWVNNAYPRTKDWADKFEIIKTKNNDLFEANRDLITDYLFVNVDEQILTLDKYTNTPSYRVGLTIVENFITSHKKKINLKKQPGSTNYSEKILLSILFLAPVIYSDYIYDMANLSKRTIIQIGAFLLPFLAQPDEKSFA